MNATVDETTRPMNSRHLLLLALFATLLAVFNSKTDVDAAPNKILMRFGKRTYVGDRNPDEWITEKDIANLRNLYYLMREGGDQQGTR
ncbi:unnamed protein product [Toxocara canis]|uniref:Neuropeptide E-V n=1 Tax=Toxocara canis TaxID=6265 RepID=A0A183V4E0_TOXCA|nr:unnamed protein product [Toxocara canis]